MGLGFALAEPGFQLGPVGAETVRREVVTVGAVEDCTELVQSLRIGIVAIVVG